MSLEVVAADVVLGTLAPHELPAVCERALGEGQNSKSLAILAGITATTYDRWEVDELWRAVLRVLSIPVPTKESAAQIVIIDAATRALRGDVAPERALARIVHGAYYGSGAAERDLKITGDSLDLGELVGLYYEYDDVDEGWGRSAEELDSEILIAFRDLLERNALTLKL